MVVAPSGEDPNYFRRCVRLVQYLALRLVARVYFWGESEILSPTVARVFSVDQIVHFCIPFWGSYVYGCARRLVLCSPRCRPWVYVPSRVKKWCAFWTTVGNWTQDPPHLILGSSPGKDVRVIYRELLRNQLTILFSHDGNYGKCRHVGCDDI